MEKQELVNLIKKRVEELNGLIGSVRDEYGVNVYMNYIPTGEHVIDKHSFTPINLHSISIRVLEEL